MEVVRQRLADETGRIVSTLAPTIALAYPSPYRVGMSSLGFQTIYRLLQDSGRVAVERFFASDADDGRLGWGHGEAERSYEGLRRLTSFRAIAFSIAYELELGPFLRMLARSGLPARASDREDSAPLVVVGGPLTCSNVRCLAPFADAVVMGEADDTVVDLLVDAQQPVGKAKRLEALAQRPGVWVPSRHGAQISPRLMCSHESLPAWAPMRTPHTELRNMALVEVVRGCSRQCQYCVMRSAASGGMRVIDPERIAARTEQQIAQGAKRFGLVGAGVSDHPKIVAIVDGLVGRGCEVGLSSLRPERLTPALLEALRRGGYKTLTTAMDGASQSLRDKLQRRTTDAHLKQAAQACRDMGLQRLKLYLMVGVPGETNEDIDQCAALLKDLSRLVPTSVGVAPFCAKLSTPLADAPFAGISTVEARVKRLRKAVAGRVEIRATSARWAWVEHVLSTGNEAEGLAVLQAEIAGGAFADYRRELAKLGHRG